MDIVWVTKKLWLLLCHYKWHKIVNGIKFFQFIAVVLSHSLSEKSEETLRLSWKSRSYYQPCGDTIYLLCLRREPQETPFHLNCLCAGSVSLGFNIFINWHWTHEKIKNQMLNESGVTDVQRPCPLWCPALWRIAPSIFLSSSLSCVFPQEAGL